MRELCWRWLDWRGCVLNIPVLELVEGILGVKFGWGGGGARMVLDRIDGGGVMSGEVGGEAAKLAENGEVMPSRKFIRVGSTTFSAVKE